MNINLTDYRGLLLGRLLLADAAALVGVVWAWNQGWVAEVWSTDVSYFTSVIAAVTIWGVVYALGLGARIGTAMDTVRLTRFQSTATPRLTDKLTPLRRAAGLTTLLGLLGTVVGFIITLQGIDVGSVADVSAISGMVTTMVAGLGVALYTTLVGGLAYIWLSVNIWSLETALRRLERV